MKKKRISTFSCISPNFVRSEFVFCDIRLCAAVVDVHETRNSRLVSFIKENTIIQFVNSYQRRFKTSFTSFWNDVYFSVSFAHQLKFINDNLREKPNIAYEVNCFSNGSNAKSILLNFVSFMKQK